MSDKSKTSYIFKKKWFNAKVEKRLPELLEPLGTGCTILEVGCWEGYSSSKWIEHLQPSLFYAIDAWGTKKQKTSEALDRFDHNVKVAQLKAKCETSIIKLNAPSQKSLKEIKETQFKFIYIDGAHTAFHVLVDIIYAFDLLEVGGIMAIDDYIWMLKKCKDENFKNIHSLCIPHAGIKVFISIFSPFIKIIHDGHQLWFEKTLDYLGWPENNLITQCGLMLNHSDWEKIPQLDLKELSF